MHEDKEGAYTLGGMHDYSDIAALRGNQPEAVGCPTQAPLPLYEWIIRVSGNQASVVSNPPAGCATTCVAAKRLERNWVGLDLWDEAEDVLQDRMKKEGMIAEDSLEVGDQLMIEPKDLSFANELPKRTDDQHTAAPFLRVKEEVKEPDGQKWSRAQMYEYLLEHHGPERQGRDRTFDDQMYLELDHYVPRSDGGINHNTNRILLCVPRNQLKSRIFSLSGPSTENKKRGYVARNLFA